MIVCALCGSQFEADELDVVNDTFPEHTAGTWSQPGQCMGSGLTPLETGREANAQIPFDEEYG